MSVCVNFNAITVSLIRQLIPNTCISSQVVIVQARID